MVALKSINSNQLYKLGKELITTHVDLCEWPKLGEPDVSQYTSEHGDYSVAFTFNPDTAEGQALIEKMEAAHDKLIALAEDWAKVKKANVMFNRPVNIKDHTDRDKELTGLKEIRLKQRAFRKDKNDNLTPTRITVTDTAGNKVPLSTLKSMGSGSKIRIAFHMVPYYMNNQLGTTFKPIKIQLVDLVRYGEVSVPDSELWDSQIDGFVAEDEEDTTTAQVELTNDVDEIEDTDDF